MCVDEIEERIKLLIKSVYDLNGCGSTDEYELSNMDSIMIISLIVLIEKEFDINIPDDYLQTNAFENVDAIVTLVKQCVKEKVKVIYN